MRSIIARSINYTRTIKRYTSAPTPTPAAGIKVKPVAPLYEHPNYEVWRQSLRYHVDANDELVSAIVYEVNDTDKVDQLVRYLADMEGAGTPRAAFRNLIQGVTDGEVPWCSALMYHCTIQVCKNMDAMTPGEDEWDLYFLSKEWSRIIASLVALRRSSYAGVVPERDVVAGEDPLLAMTKAILAASKRKWMSGGTTIKCVEAMTTLTKGLRDQQEAELAKQVLVYIEDSRYKY